MKKSRHPKVFVVQEGPHDYTPAQNYGEVVFLSKDEISPFPSSLRNKTITRAMYHQLSTEYVAGFDYLLPTGSPIAIAFVFLVLEHSKPGERHRLLKWDNRSHEYHEYSVAHDEV